METLINNKSLYWDMDSYGYGGTVTFSFFGIPNRHGCAIAVLPTGTNTNIGGWSNIVWIRGTLGKMTNGAYRMAENHWAREVGFLNRTGNGSGGA